MKLKIMVDLMVCFLIGGACADEMSPGGVTDEWIAGRIARLARFEDVDESVDRALLQQCNNDTNRFCRIARELYMTNVNDRVKSQALSMFWSFGTSQDEPFLETCILDLKHGEYALRIMNHIEGFTSNSVLRTARYHAVTNQEVFNTDKDAYSNRGSALNNLAFAASKPNVNIALRKFTSDYIFSYASNNCYQIGTSDRALIKLDPTYKNSKRRLGLLRLAQSVVLGPFSAEYVTNAINELVAYPEANLPE